VLALSAPAMQGKYNLECGMRCGLKSSKASQNNDVIKTVYNTLETPSNTKSH